MGTWKKQDIFKLVVTSVLILAMFALFIPFYSETLLAGVFALAIEPALGRYLQSKHLRWKASVAGILGAMFLIVAGPISMVAYKAYIYFSGISQTGFQNTEIFKKLVLFRAQLLKFANQLLHTMHMENQIDLAGLSEEALNKMGTLFVAVSTNFIYRVPEVLLSVFVFCVALYFFLAEARLIKGTFLRLQFLTLSESEKLIRVMQKSSFNTVVTSVSLGAIAASIVSLGSLILRGGDFTVVFVITFFCSFIPVIGAGPVALVLGLYKLVLEAYGEATGFLIVAIIVGIVDNVVRPYLISSNEADLPPAISLLTLIGALMIFGAPGIFLGPVIASMALAVVPIFYPSASGPIHAERKKKS
jgi:predicted PurR-regulated permease PerM